MLCTTRKVKLNSGRANNQLPYYGSIIAHNMTPFFKVRTTIRDDDLATTRTDEGTRYNRAIRRNRAIDEGTRYNRAIALLAFPLTTLVLE